MNIFEIPLMSRKFLFAVLVVILGFIAVCIHQVSAREWFGFAELIGATYIVGNIADNLTQPIIEKTPLDEPAKPLG